VPTGELSGAELASVLARLEAMGASELRRAWQEDLGSDPPTTFTARLMRHALAWHLQSGGHPAAASTSRALDRVATRRAGGAGASEAVTGLKPPPTPVGTRLMKSWGGQNHEVIILADGVLWRGRTYSSLSVVAREITGCPRNGPRFFGLRGGVP
jgi:hypothetical protein